MTPFIPVALLVPMAVWDPSVLQKVLISVFGLVLIIVGIAVAAGAKKAQYHETARVGVNTVVAIVIAGLGLGTIAFAAFGKQLLTTFGVNVG